MSTKRYTEAFEVKVIGQVMHNGYRLANVAARLGVSQHSLYQWSEERRGQAAERQAQATQSEEVRRL